ncbi:dTDP-4-dehydrorhamnose 3,5-epimerase [Leptospira yasudae]|uniref:dTDP-4-dehydrorhamnose 3,5-epimerase n=1 Tax=Leptospira yasudae TaxID=2202201 RepID=A0ABX9LZ84_9LEPT|nr:dTDP-4-dehydrorhamnose 3,5-epimerase [Leptospira yasudae]MBW0434160.1 dTDP-4-dehydrorhamnose 3,5-epimerase [Leptospira yasudae]RHX78239.1 dTDP-4-dehydrorhamnose 3,5-epimerase [Leptospira yasudae]TGK24549.1 dTDP-4-dehydrorhamnose 3,5-epimerase [Leptospira yasudae]TGM05665.1 dTDP-4-dehydrorhamnose 3,5-epimerase [Leptospira yasudae]TGM96649.1 dTDP-4-dehydrorhamnose 3,5-epimerase [Leptospira yasudae]
MQFKRFPIDGPVLIEPKVFGDERGFFFESFKDSAFKQENIPTDFFQDNHSRSARGVLRGMHMQIPPYEQGKLVRVVRGRVIDVVVDIRVGSPTFAQWVSVELSEENKNIFWVPPGFAHGFITLEDKTDFLYKVTQEYNPKNEVGIRWNDPALGIPWKTWLPDSDFIISQRDQETPLLADFKSPFVY